MYSDALEMSQITCGLRLVVMMQLGIPGYRTGSRPQDQIPQSPILTFQANLLPNPLRQTLRPRSTTRTRPTCQPSQLLATQVHPNPINFPTRSRAIRAHNLVYQRLKRERENEHMQTFRIPRCRKMNPTPMKVRRPEVV